MEFKIGDRIWIKDPDGNFYYSEVEDVISFPTFTAYLLIPIVGNAFRLDIEYSDYTNFVFFDKLGILFVKNCKICTKFEEICSIEV